MSIRRAARLAGALGVLAVLVAPALPGSTGHRAYGHAQLVTSAPGAGVVVLEAPRELRLVFSEPLEAEVTSLDVRDADDELVVERAGAPDPADPFVLVAELPPLPDGVYSVTWRTLSAADGHTAEGFFSFGVGSVTLSPTDVGGSAHGETDLLDVAARLFTYAGIVAAVGLTTFSTLVLGAGGIHRPLARLISAALLLGGVATVVAAVANAVAAGDALGYLTESRTGLLQLARGGVALVAAALVLVAAASATAIAMTAGIGIAALLVVAGHASALPGPVPLAAGVVHVIGAAVWLGGVVGLALLATRPPLVVEGTPPTLRSIIPRFSALALAAIGLVGVTGVVAAWWHTGTLLDPATEYGRALLAKTVLAVIALGIGALNFLDVGAARDWAWAMARRVRAEALLGAGVLVATAVLATSSPNDGSGGVAVGAVPDALGAISPDMSLTLAPGRPGPNRAVVETTDALAMSNLRLELVLDRLDTGTTTRIELHHPEMSRMHGMEGMEGMSGHDADSGASDHGTVHWLADAIVLPAGSRWDANVLTISSPDAELDRQRFSFALDADGISDGRVGSPVTPATLGAAIFVIGGAVAIGLGIGGWSLPRSDPRTSAIALQLGGATGLVLGVAIGADALLRLL